MVVRSKRKAREAALRTLYEIELGHSDPTEALQITLEEASLAPDISAYAEKLVLGIRKNQHEIDRRLAYFIKEYDYSRIAAVDRNILRVAAYEILELPEIPPAVTINEAIEIAKRYSTAESGKFVNGVLGALLKDTPKANWDPETAPPEIDYVVSEEPEPEIIEEVVEEGSEDAKIATRYGVWKLQSGNAKIPSNTEGK